MYNVSVRNDVLLPAEGKYFLRIHFNTVCKNRILTLLHLFGFTRGKNRRKDARGKKMQASTG
jgi:hypothetical protein